MLALFAAAPFLCGFGPQRSAGAGSASLGLADAQVAAGVGGGALYANPAGMSQLQHGVLETGFARSGQAGSGAPYASYVDSTSAWGLAAGVGYASEQAWGVDSPLLTGHDVRLGLSAGGESDAGKLLLGGSARWLAVQRTGGPEVSGWTGDFGAIVGLQGFRIGAVLRNAFLLSSREAPRRIATAIGYVGSQFVVEGGGSWGVGNGDNPGPGAATGQSYRAGAGYQFGQEGLQLRAGYHFDQTVRGAPIRHWACAGMAWRTPKVSFDLAGGFDTGNDHAALISASLTFLVPYDLDAP